MLRALMKLKSLLDASDAARLRRLLIVIAVMVFAEVGGIALVLPFLRLVADPDAIPRSEGLSWLYATVGFSSHRAMLVGIGWTVIALMGLSNLLGALGVWMRYRIAWSLAHSVSMRLVAAYSRLPYEFFLQRNSAQLIRKTIDDVNSLVIGVLITGCQCISQATVAVAIAVLLLFAHPMAAVSAFGLFTGVYGAIYLARRTYLLRLGEDRLEANYDRYRAFVEFIHGIKTIRSCNASEFFAKRFEEASERFSVINPKVHTTTQAPKYFVDTVVFGAILVLVLSMTDAQQTLSTSLPLITLFAVAGYRLLPAVNGVYAALAQFRGSLPAIDAIYGDIHAATKTENATDSKLVFDNEIRLDAISFHYETSGSDVVDQVSLRIPKGSRVAFVGPTGSGKTTLIDILIGLLQPQAGGLWVDNTRVNLANRSSWQATIGYVPQDVFVYDDRLEDNVAFGLPLDRDHVRQVCEIAQLSSFIENELSEGYRTVVGEGGCRLSGGQRQRLGLARALYRRPQVLVLDEATSALDAKTENAVIAAIHERLPGITIVMIAHRISTVRRCDRLFMMDRGRILSEGSYEDLLASSELFGQLARFT